jgi:predicted GNAT family acetyltransferase
MGDIDKFPDNGGSNVAFKIRRNKIEYKEDGKVLGEVVFPDVGLDLVCICSTFVEDELRGQGIAAQLLELTVEELRKTNRKAMLKCSYAVKWFEENKQYPDVLEENGAAD